MSEISNSITSNMHKQASENYKTLLSNIKHDLTNPINAILGFSELILDYLKEGTDGQLIADVKNIHESGSLLFENINTYFTNNEGGDRKYIGDIINISELQFSIRTPISTILGMAELLKEDAGNNSTPYGKDINDSLDKIHMAGKSLLVHINELKKYSNVTVEEFLKNYKSDLYLNDSSLKLYKKMRELMLQ